MIDAPPTIQRFEFEDRRRKAVEQAKSRGLKGLLVCSRGGGSLDRYADVKYLTNFYTPFPCIPDLAKNWSGRGHAFFVLPVDAEPLLVADVPNDGSIALDEDRRRKAVEQAKSRGLRGLLVCSRGGGSLDRYADVKYLTNFYTPFPCIPDLAKTGPGAVMRFSFCRWTPSHSSLRMYPTTAASRSTRTGSAMAT